jgi:hypothetical protein
MTAKESMIAVITAYKSASIAAKNARVERAQKDLKIPYLEWESS